MMHVIAHGAPRALGAALLLAASLAAAPRSSMAAQAPQDAGAFIADLGTQAIQVLGPQVPAAQRAARFRQLFQNDFDLPQLARFVLGPQGHNLAPQEQEEFYTLFREFLVQSYTTRLAEYAGEPFRVTGSRSTGDDTIVASQVIRKSGQPVELNWHVIDRDGHFLITDVDVDGVSMKMTQRNAFANIIQRNGGNASSLIAVLRQQLAQEPAATSGSSKPRLGPPG
ncbi:MAG TPA: ABC transporter substrate-binding protein [Stellaceae bacterium]|jgi:phospholipid transport system substrate-binding protein|nr:ABC transporter substrate-binding protein [Stellaceae bacterium]